MPNPTADYPTALHTATDTSGFGSTALGSTTPTHTAVEGKQESEVLAVQTKIGTGSSTPTDNKFLRGTGTGTSANWGGTVTAYFEATFLTDNASGTATVALHDSSNNLVTGADLTTSATTAAQRIRSAAITLVNGTAYKVRMKSNNAAYTTTIRYARIILVQTVSALPTETYFDLTSSNEATTSTTRSLISQPVYHDTDEWSGVTLTPIFETWFNNSNASYTTTADLWDGSSAVATNTTTSTAYVRGQDTTVTLTDNTGYDLGITTTNAAGTANVRRAYLIYQIVASAATRRRTMV